MSENDKPPNRAALLFDQLVGRQERLFDRLSNGIGAALDNANALVEDAAILVAAKRYERAEFLIATAQEEMGKTYILIDAARVDIARQDVLRRLCRAFYDHVLKRVYFDLSAHQYPGIWELDHVRHYFGVGLRKWWPAPAESGQPDMPHDTYFLREANLYVDFDGFSGTWTVPRQPAKSMLFETPFASPLDDARATLQQLRETREGGFFGASALHVLSRCMRKLQVTASTPTAELLANHKRTGVEMEKELGLPASAFMRSQLRNWPMYWLVP